jgi:hypothetical protein
VETIRELLIECLQQREFQIEQLNVLHEKTLSQLHAKITDCQRTIAQKELLMVQMQGSMTQSIIQRRAAGTALPPDVYQNELSKAQRQVLELQSQIVNMRQSQREMAKAAPVASLPPPPVSAPPDEPPPADISVGRELAYTSKIKVLQDQINDLKSDGKLAHDQLLRAKQTELALEKRVQMLDHLHKAAEASLEAATKKLSAMEAAQERQLAEAKQEAAHTAQLADGAASIHVRMDYEKKLTDQAEEFRKQAASARETLERKLRAQMKDMVAACQSGDATKAVDQAMKQLNEELMQVREEAIVQRQELRQKADKQFQELVRQYEGLMHEKDLELVRVRRSVEAEASARMITMQIESEEKMAQKILAINEAAGMEAVKLRRALADQLDILKQKLLLVTRERDTLKRIVGDEELTHEEEDQGEAESTSDNALEHSLEALRVRELEQSMSQKYALLLQTQKNLMEENVKWQVDQARLYFKAEFDAALDKIREGIATRTTAFQDELQSADPGVRKFFSDILQSLGVVAKSSSSIAKAPVIPLAEVDHRMNAVREKLLQLIGDTTLWKETSEALGSLEGKSTEDILEALKQAISLHAERVTLIMRENKDLRRRLAPVPVISRGDLFICDCSCVNFPLVCQLDTVVECNRLCESCDTSQPETIFHAQLEESERDSEGEREEPKVGERKEIAIVSGPLGLAIGACISIPPAEIPQGSSIRTFEPSTTISPPAVTPAATETHPEVPPAAAPTEPQPVSQSVTEAVPISPLPSQERPPLSIFESFSFEEEEGLFVQEDREAANLLLAETKQQNTELKQKMIRMVDLQREYMKKIEDLSARLTDLEQSVFAHSINAARDARALPSVPENMDAKIQATVLLAKSFAELPKPITVEGAAAAQDVANAVRTMTEDRLCVNVDEVLDRTEQALLTISAEPRRHTSGSLAILERLEALQDDLVAHRQAFAAFWLEQRVRFARAAAAARGLTSHLRNTKRAHGKAVDDLNVIIARRTSQLAQSESELRAQQTTSESLQMRLRETASCLQSLSIERQSASDEIEVLKENDEAQSQQIDHLLRLLTEASQTQSIGTCFLGAPLSFVSPFVIYSTVLRMSNRGFALMPLNTVVFERTPPPSRHEKVRIHVGRSPQAKVIVPKVVIAGDLPRFQTSPTTPRTSVCLSFDRLVPLSDDDTTGGLVAYVTRYVSEMSLQAKRARPPAVSASPVLISEVPADVLRLDTPRPLLRRPTAPSPDRRLRHLERLVQEAADELAAERARARDSTRQIFALKMRLEKAERKAHKNGLLHSAAKKRLAQALGLLTSSDREVLKLKQMVREAEVLADLEQPQDDRQSEDLLTAMRRVSAGLGEMAVREMEATRRWSAKKERYMRQERAKIFATLDAMQFVTQMSEPTTQQSITISSMKRQRKRVEPPPDTGPCPSPDQAIVTANAHVQELPDGLKRGVVSS